MYYDDLPDLNELSDSELREFLEDFYGWDNDFITAHNNEKTDNVKIYYTPSEFKALKLAADEIKHWVKCSVYGKTMYRKRRYY